MDETSNAEEIGVIKYSGEGLEAGVIDARTAGLTLTGLDEAIRYFNIKQSPNFRSMIYDVPVQTRPGSWEAVLMATTAAGAGSFAFSYMKKAGELTAQNDFKDASIKRAFVRSLEAIQAFVSLVKHSKMRSDWNAVRVEPSLEYNYVVVENDRSEEIRVPLEYYRWFEQMPQDLLAKMTQGIRRGRALTIISNNGEQRLSVSIAEEEKYLFEKPIQHPAGDEILFPELVHGAHVRLAGRLIRGNEASNSVGLVHEGHVINCVPGSGSVRRYKSALFSECLVEGTVTRHPKGRFVADRRPTIILERVSPIVVAANHDLF